MQSAKLSPSIFFSLNYTYPDFDQVRPRTADAVFQLTLVIVVTARGSYLFVVSVLIGYKIYDLGEGSVQPYISYTDIGHGGVVWGDCTTSLPYINYIVMSFSPASRGGPEGFWAVLVWPKPEIAHEKSLTPRIDLGMLFIWRTMWPMN